MWLENVNPVWIVAIVAIATIFYKIVSWAVRVDEFKGTTNKFLQGFREDLNGLTDDIKAILLRLPSGAVHRGSSLRLTELGEKISNELGAAAWAKAQAQAENLADSVKEMSSYKVQDRCFSFVRTEIKPEDPYHRQIEECAFDNGLSITDVLQVIGIELRDHLLSQRTTKSNKHT